MADPILVFPGLQFQWGLHFPRLTNMLGVAHEIGVVYEIKIQPDYNLVLLTDDEVDALKELGHLRRSANELEALRRHWVMGMQRERREDEIRGSRERVMRESRERKERREKWDAKMIARKLKGKAMGLVKKIGDLF